MEILLVGVAVILATCVVFGYLGFIWWLDRYEREPFWMVILTFLYGGLFGTAFGCFFSIFPSLAATGILGASAGGVVSTVLVAPFVEEFTKGLIFAVLVLTKHFDNETDGLIYGAATGLGFACVENLMYFATAQSVESLMTMVVLRTLFTALVHCISSATLGMAIGIARQKRGFGLKAMFVIGGYLLAVTNHAVWNGLATASGFESMVDTGLSVFLTLFGCGLVAIASLTMFGITQYSLKREHDVIKKFLALEAEQGLIPAAHVEIIPYWLKRRKRDWLAPAIPRADYVEAATMLAFRRHQLEFADGARRTRIQKDIDDYRSQLREFLGSS